MDPSSSSSSSSSSVQVSDSIFFYDEAAHYEFLMERPWNSGPHYFKRVKISALALFKMLTHTCSSANVEITGLTHGKADGDAIILLDAFAVPVEVIETRVDPQRKAIEYIVQYIHTSKQAGRLETDAGWYHSHPGYGCWLSGKDVATQRLYQIRREPFVAVVIDSARTAFTGKVVIGAFRTYPVDKKFPDDGPTSEYQTIPLDKIEDFRWARNKHYPLEITYFMSSLDSYLLDLLWDKCWMSTLVSPSSLGNIDYIAGQISDLAEKIELVIAEKIELVELPHSEPEPQIASSSSGKKDESELAKINRDSSKLAVEQLHVLMSRVMKDFLFNSVVGQANKSKAETSDPLLNR